MAYIDRVSGELEMTYVVQAETFYADGHAEPGLSIYCQEIDDDAPIWQAQMHERGGDEMEIVRLEIFSDGFAAFAQFPAFFEALATDPPRSLIDVRALLTRLGAVDVTPRHPRTVTTNRPEREQ